MSEFAKREKLIQIADVMVAPLAANATEAPARESIDRCFELPNGLYATTIALYLGYVGVMAGAFGNPSLAVPLAVIAFFIVAAFAVPALWIRMRPEHRQQALTFAALRNRGVQTGSGTLEATSAAVQVLIMPVLILFWGVAVSVIAALT